MFQGKTALVIGATSGMGEASARAFAREGASVVVAGRRVDRGESIAASIREAGGEATFLPCDVGSEQSIIDVVAGTVARYGRLDCAVNNAALEIAGGLLHERPTADCDAILAINVRGVFLSMKYQITQMLQNGGGAIVNVTSSSAHVGFPTAALYTGTKHAIDGMSKAAALEYVKLGIRINCVAPGLMASEMMQRYCDSVGITVQDVADTTPIGRPARPEELASAVLWLCSPGASFAVGTSLVVDGGMIAA